MRAIYYPFDHKFTQRELIIDNDQFHHLKNVLRVKQGDDLLILNGKGYSISAKVDVISKKQIVLELGEQLEKSKNFHLDIFIGQLKKDAMDLCLKQCVELGINKVYIGSTQYSQKYKINESRLQKILVSALEQSNAYFLPEVIFDTRLEDINTEVYDSAFLFGTRFKEKREETCEKNEVSTSNCIYFIGPEGGFSEEEEQLLSLKKNVQTIMFKSNILRATSAVSVAAGYCFAVHSLVE